MAKKLYTKIVMETGFLDEETGEEIPSDRAEDFQGTIFYQKYPLDHYEEHIKTQQRLFPAVNRTVEGVMIEAGDEYIARRKAAEGK